MKLSLAGFRLAASIGSGIDLNKDLFVNVSIEIMHYNAVIIGVDRLVDDQNISFFAFVLLAFLCINV